MTKIIEDKRATQEEIEELYYLRMACDLSNSVTVFNALLQRHQEIAVSHGCPKLGLNDYYFIGVDGSINV
jgi:hypothetical protein